MTKIVFKLFKPKYNCVKFKIGLKILSLILTLVKIKAENTFYYAVFGASFIAFASICYYLVVQFFSPKSPQRIYSRALKIIRDDLQCQEIFGPKIAAHGEDSGRGRRRHIANYSYVKDGEERVRISFHIKGDKNIGRALTEVYLFSLS